MREPQAQIVLLVRAFEEVDRDGRLLSTDERLAATRRAVMVTTTEGEQERFSREGTLRNDETVVRRARLLYNALARRIPSLHRVLEFARLRSLMGPALIAVAFVVGLGTNALGPERRINLLSLPILGLLAWNIGSYVLGLVARLVLPAVSGRFPASSRTAEELADAAGGERLVHGLTGWVVRLALWRSRLGWKRRSRSNDEQERIIARGFLRFSALWRRLTGRLLESRVRRRLHLGAAALMLGVLVGMYVRGLAFEYRATWESTLLDADGVQALLESVLGAASLLLGQPVPDVAPLRSPASGPAALWLHLYAVTALVFVVLPRGLLALNEAVRSSRMKSDLPLDLDDGYYRRILSQWRGALRRVEVLPYSYAPQDTTLQHLKGLLQDFFGARADMRLQEPVPYGSGADELAERREGHCAPDAPEEAYVVVLFNLAQTPEREVHGAFLEMLLGCLDPERCKLLVLVDESGYRRQTGSEERCRERRDAWERTVAEAGLLTVPIDPNRAALDPRIANDRLNALRQAIAASPRGRLAAP